jgi:hypothetical protein
MQAMRGAQQNAQTAGGEFLPALCVILDFYLVGIRQVRVNARRWVEVRA